MNPLDNTFQTISHKNLTRGREEIKCGGKTMSYTPKQPLTTDDHMTKVIVVMVTGQQVIT